ncbi:MAG: 3-oxoacyl-[acyl-carrier-protein] reductase [Alphaproteobacteria bacterium]|nr:3-oxoacyl-[acyl-carrier-protein] reductase [Alphaproteobacteria bacterium]
MSLFGLHDKKALVTGATGGIGAAIAKAFHEAGAAILISGSKQEKLVALAGELGGRAHPLACDLSKLDVIEGFAKEAEEQLGGLDVLVANAGITRDTLAIRMSDEQWQQVIDINLTATFRLIRAALKGMMKRKSGRIIIITSVVGHSGNAGQANYCAAKAGLTGMAKALALEVASRGITVNCIAPGFIVTPMTDVLNEEQKARVLGRVPQGHMGTPEDIAAAALYLASDAASYVTGETLHVNGGLYLA